MKKKTEPGKPVGEQRTPEFRKKNATGPRPGKGSKKRFDALDRFHKAYGSSETPAPGSEARSKRTSRPAADKDRPTKPGGGAARKDTGRKGSGPKDPEQRNAGRKEARSLHRSKDNEEGAFRGKKAYREKPASDKDKRHSSARDMESRNSGEKRPYGRKQASGKDEEHGTAKSGRYPAGKSSGKYDDTPGRTTHSFSDTDPAHPSRPARATGSEGRPSARPGRSSGSADSGHHSGPAGPGRPAKPGGARFNSDRYQNRFEHQRPSYQSVRDTEDEEEENATAAGPMPLNKFIAHSGECSRRDAAALVKQGKVRVNGELILEPGYKVSFDDKVTLGGKKLAPRKGLVYILMNKPKGFITTTDDPAGRRTVMDLVANAGAERVFPVGRLDRNTTGLLLLTNDGDLAQKLSHPRHKIKKIYQVTLDKAITKADFDKVVNGVELEDGVAPVDSLAYLEEKNEVGIEIHSGRNRIVRRIFESLGYEVTKLDRVMYAGLTKKNLPRGKWRFLSEREVILLRHFRS